MDTEREHQFDWPLCYEAEGLILGQLDNFTARNKFAAQLAGRLQAETGTLLLDWVDHLVWPQADVALLRQTGFTSENDAETPAGLIAWRHPEAMLPWVLTSASDGANPLATETIALRCDSVVNFLVAHGISAEPEGAPLSRYRSVRVAEENDTRVRAVERRGYRGFVVPSRDDGPGAGEVLRAAESWRLRRRHFPADADGFRATLALADQLVARLGRDLACHVIFAEERDYWQRRNRAAAVQKERQDKLGLGWANHDHHTFRSSRERFVDLMSLLEQLGFERRERYYAGAQAGWGAQILEQSVEGLVAFCDVDLLPEETEIDFSREPLPPAPKLGTIGLWVGLHGESALGAGMHHLECRFDHEALRAQLGGCGIQTMKPFSDFPFLRQAFTEGEKWAVDRTRAERLRQSGLISDQQLDQFLREGAIGSHLENLQRKGGFKGFNQKSVSAIITATDPRKTPASGA
jgi:hypothetical protein